MVNQSRSSGAGSLSSSSKSIIAGSSAGMASVVVCHPLDTIRTRLQISNRRFQNSLVVCTRQTLAREGLGGLYKGFWPPFFSQAVYKSVIFTISSQIRELTRGRLSDSMSSLVAGAVAGGVNALLVTPVELVRNRLQVQYDTSPRVTGMTTNDKMIITMTGNSIKHDSSNITFQYRNTWNCIHQVVRHEGFFALWKGLVTTILRDSLGVAVYFLAFEKMKSRLSYSLDRRPEDTLLLLTSGACGGIAFWMVALPFDTVKSLVQVQTTGRNNWYRCGQSLVEKHGVKSLFRGWQAAFSRGIPGAAITFLTFDRVKCTLDQLDASDAG